MRLFHHYCVTLLATLLAIGSASFVGFAQQRAATPSAGQAQSAVERGKYLVTVMDCNGCHTPFKMGEPDMTRMLSGHPQDVKIAAAPPIPSGGIWATMINETNTAWAGPWGVSFTTNLTPDPTGLGTSEQAFVDSIRNGKHLGTGRAILPPMPWKMYSQLTDNDLKAIFAYLRTIPAISNRVPAPMPPPGRGR
jgi:mono/diheme cytochrome c family protein